MRTTMKRTTRAVAVVTALLMFGIGHWSPACALLYGTVVSGSSDSVLVTIDPASGAATSVGTVTGFPRIDGLAARSDNTLFGGQALTNYTGPMLTIDRTTAAGTSLGASGMFGIYALAFSSGGTLYAACAHYSPDEPDALCTVNQSNGAATVVGAYDSTNFGIWVDGLAFNGSTLYGSMRSTSAAGAALYTVNTSNGAATVVAKICTPTACGSGGTQISAGVVGLTLVGSTLYGSTSDGNIITIDTATGVYSLVGSIGMAGAVQDLTVLSPPATATPTFTPTPFATAAEIPTATPTPIPPCTLPSPQNQCVPGKGPANTGCNMEWLFTAVPLLNPKTGEPLPNTNKAGIPNNQLICYEGDPRCDFDQDLGNGSCTLHTAVCINNNDPRLSCVPSGINTAQVKNPNPLRLSSDGSDQTNFDSLESQFDNAAGGGFGVTVLESIPGGTKIKYSGTTNPTPNLCSAPLSIVVPEAITATGHVVKGRKTLTTVVTAISGKKDTDTLRLECRPSTCGDGIVQKNHETCDDANGDNGDGCNQACQIEPGFVCPVPGQSCISLTPTSTPTSGLPTSTSTSTPTSTPGVPTDTPTSTHRPAPTNTPTNTSTPTETPPPLLAPTPTVTPQAAAVCGNGIIESGETCDDGNTVTNPPEDTCPADCTIITCTPGGAKQVVSVTFTPPTGKNVASITVVLEYPDGTVQIPGTADDDSVTASVTNTPSGFLVATYDYDYALKVGVAGTRAITVGQLFRATFDLCQGATAPTAAAFKCTVTDASGTNFQPVSGVTCAVTLL